MNKEQFEKAYLMTVGVEQTSMVINQVNKLIFSGYSYQEILRAIWHLLEVKNLDKERINKYGIGILTSENGMDESIRYFRNLEATRKLARESAIRSKNKKAEHITIKRQKRKRHREEFDWDE